MGNNWSKSHSSNIWGVFGLNQVQIMLSVVGRELVGGKLQVISDPF